MVNRLSYDLDTTDTPSVIEITSIKVNPIEQLRNYLGISNTYALSKVMALVNNYPPDYSGAMVYSGNKGISYYDDFYQRIRYFPTFIDLGAITSNQTRELYVFNGFYPDNKGTSLEGVTLIDGEGIELLGPSTPAMYAPLQLQLYTVNIQVDGPATISTIINYDWEAPIESGGIQLLGSRIVAFPYLFRNGVQETLSWATQVITSNAGLEQRIRLRDSPRQAFAIDSFIPREEWNLSDNLLFAWRGNTWGLPVYTEARLSTSPVLADSKVIPVSTAYGDFRVGELAIIMKSSQIYTILQVESFDSVSITASQVLGITYPAGSIVAPVRPCRMTVDPTRGFTGASVHIQASFESVDNITLPDIPASIQFQGYDVWLGAQYFLSEEATDVYTRRVDVIDFISSPVKTFSKWYNTKPRRTFAVQTITLQELWEFRLWLHRRAGAWRPFWAPTQENNFRLTNTGFVSSVLTAIDEGQAVYGEDKRYLLIRLKSGPIIRTITDIARNEGIVTMALDSSVGVARSEILTVEYLGLRRLATDRIELLHKGNFAMDCSLPMLEIDQ